MGHGDKIHRDYYRQPIVTRDIVTISKLLSLAQGDDDNNGGAKEIINERMKMSGIEITELATDEDHIIDDNTEADFEKHGNTSNVRCNKMVTSEPTKSSKVNRIVKKSWTTPEKRAVRTAFADHISNGTFPTLTECLKVIEETPARKVGLHEN